MDLRKIDALVAEHVFGYVIINPELFTRPGDDREYLLPKYSSDISAAWEVVRVLNKQGVYLSIHTGPGKSVKVTYQRYKSRTSIDIDEGTIVNDTGYVAICLAAFKLKDINYEL